VVHRCRRRGSLDAAIEGESVEANDVGGFLRDHPGITHVFFNGGAAQQLFRRWAPLGRIRGCASRGRAARPTRRSPRPAIASTT
jgi:G:T/U-mismatch repair DNA glycosylase